MCLFRKKSKAAFPFPDPPDTVCFTCRHIIGGGLPILRVSHDEDDGAWQFLCGGEHNLDDAMIVSMYEMLRLDPSVAEVAGMPCGCLAERTDAGSPWVLHNGDRTDN